MTDSDWCVSKVGVVAPREDEAGEDVAAIFVWADNKSVIIVYHTN